MLFKLAKVLLAAIFSITCIVLVCQAQPKVKQAGKEKPQPLTSRVILISISGLSANDLTSSKSAKLNIPTLREWISNGAFALNVESVYPTQSLPALTTIVTGLLPTDHGITSNIAFDEQKGAEISESDQPTRVIKTDSIIEAARRENLKIDVVGFPISINNEIRADSINSLLPSKSRKDTLAAIKKRDQETAFTAIESLKLKQPALLLMHLNSYDLAQKYFGVSSQEAIDTLINIDSLLKQLNDALTRERLINDTTFVVVSDHGVAKVENKFSPNSVLIHKGFLKIDEQGKVVSWRAKAQTYGGSAAIFLQNPNDEQTAREVEAAFQEIHQQVSSPLWRILTRRDATRLGADHRVFLYLDAAPGILMVETREINPDNNSIRATSGYLPQRLEMRATLIAVGKGIKPKTQIEYARLIDVAPTISRLLGFELRATRGRVISEFFIQPNEQ